MKFKVIVLSVSGKGKKIYKSQDIIDEMDLPDGNAEQLVAKGYLKPVEETTEETSAPKLIDDITKNELIGFLNEKEVAYNPRSNKSELYALYQENF